MQSGQARESFFGKYRGVVTDNVDPMNLGRIRARVLALFGENQTVWAVPCVPYAGEGVGHYLVPPVGAGVWIEFEAGDPSQPIWSGCWWGKDEIPRDNSGELATESIKITRSETGLMLTMNDQSQTVSLSDANGENVLTIDVAAGEITIKADRRVSIEAPLIELVEGSSHPAVFGDRLLQYLNQLVTMFNTHLHPGELAGGVAVTPAPAVPPLPAVPSDLLSTRVKSG